MDTPETRSQQTNGTILLVDDEENILSSLRRLLRRDGYHILTAQEGKIALDILAKNTVDVIISDQRMPGMTGTEFLRQARDIHPDTIRIVLSGYTELESVTSAINDGAVYKFLTKPWDDDLLRTNIAEAFRRKRLDDENRRLQMELADANVRLISLIHERQHLINLTETSLVFSHETLALLPIPVIGIDSDQLIVLANEAAQLVLGSFLLGSNAKHALPQVLYDALTQQPPREIFQSGSGQHYRIECHPLGTINNPRGHVMALNKIEQEATA